MEERELKALEIAAKSKLTQKGKTWLVPSQSVRGAQYTVNLDSKEPHCSCPDFECRKQRCKHIFAVEYTVERRPRLPLADIIFSSAFKIYSTLSARRFMTDLREAKQRGYISKLPAYNSLFRYLEAETLTPHLYQMIMISSLPLI